MISLLAKTRSSWLFRSSTKVASSRFDLFLRDLYAIQEWCGVVIYSSMFRLVYTELRLCTQYAGVGQMNFSVASHKLVVALIT